MLKIKYIVLVLSAFIFFSCTFGEKTGGVMVNNVEDKGLICELDKYLYETKENIVLSYGWNNYKGIFYNKKHNCEISIQIYKVTDNNKWNIRQAFEVRNTGSLIQKEEDFLNAENIFSAYLYRDDSATNFNEKLIISIDEEGKYRIYVSFTKYIENSKAIEVAFPMSFYIEVQ